MLLEAGSWRPKIWVGGQVEIGNCLFGSCLFWCLLPLCFGEHSSAEVAWNGPKMRVKCVETTFRGAYSYFYNMLLRRRRRPREWGAALASEHEQLDPLARLRLRHP